MGLFSRKTKTKSSKVTSEPSNKQNYQLVIQLAASSITDYDKLVELEKKVEEVIAGEAYVDGHDMGEGEANIFIITDNPQQTFEEIKVGFVKSPLWNDFKIAFRELNGETYTVLWPQELTTFSIK